MAVNRETVRDELAELLTAALVGDGLPCQSVYNYRRGNLKGTTAVACVVSAGSQRARLGRDETPGFYLDVISFVLYSDAGAWNEDDAEDCLDRIESIVAGVVESHRRHPGYWQYLDYDGPSQRLSVMLSGTEYIMETIPLRAAVF